MSRLIVLSNRVKSPDNMPAAGGLAVALYEVLLESCGIWMGWNGEITDRKSPSGASKLDAHNEFSYRYAKSSSSHPTYSKRPMADHKRSNAVNDNNTLTYVTTAFTPKQYQHFYCGFANNVLWPLLHERTDLIRQAPQDYAGYQAVNQLFAQQLRSIIEPDDVIWVHDYHFLSMAYYCRKLGMSNRIGFFLHIPFAPLTAWQQLHQSAELIEHLAHYDVIGTQTQKDKSHCLTVFYHYLKDRLSKNQISPSHQFCSGSICSDSKRSDRSIPARIMLNLDKYSAHRLVIQSYPIGVNVSRIQHQSAQSSQTTDAQAAPSQQSSQYLDEHQSAQQQIIAVDRIDYSKGLLARFGAYQAFLQQYPSYQQQLKLLQIACPSRLDLPVYQQLYNDVRQTVNRLNQQFSPNEPIEDAFKANQDKSDEHDDNSHWQAVNYSEKVLSHDSLMKVFRRSDVGWVNSLKDGMNLVAKEYIAAQNPDNPGVLLLSRYAGAAEQMQAAIIIDPSSSKSVTQGLHRALTMPIDERQTRYQTLIQGLRQYDLHDWQQSFLADLYQSSSPWSQN